jgi:hypothetical protein
MKKLLAVMAFTMISGAYASEVCTMRLFGPNFQTEFIDGTGPTNKKACREAQRECNKKKMKLNRTEGLSLECEFVDSSADDDVVITPGPIGPGPVGPGPVILSNRNVQINDRVILDSSKDDYSTVVGRYARDLVVKTDYSYYTTTVDYDNISLTTGCLNGVNLCVGDRVVPAGYNEDMKIIGINYAKGTLTLKRDYYSNFVRITAETVALRSGCIESYNNRSHQTVQICVGDKVIPMDFDQNDATVIAVNPMTRSAIVKKDWYSNYYTRTDAQLAITNGCMGKGRLEICVGQTVYPRSMNRGVTVVGLNPITSEVIVRKSWSNTNIVIKRMNL